MNCSITLLTLALLLPPAFGQESVRLRGEIVLHEEHGAERVPVSGTVEFWIARHGWHSVVAQVEQGRFEAQIPVGWSWLDVGRLELDGREAWCAFGLETELPAEPIRLVAQVVKPCTLRVLAGRTGRDFDDFEILETRSDSRVPTQPGVRGMRAASPFAVPLWRRDGDEEEVAFHHGWYGTRTYLVRAPGMAWASITIDPSKGGTRWLFLVPEARLSLRLDQGNVPSDVTIEVRRDVQDSSGIGRIFFKPDNQLVEIEGLPAGRYWVVAELLDLTSRAFPGGRTGRFLALESADLRSGESRHVEIALRNRAEPLDVSGQVCAAGSHLRGTLKVPDEWDVSNPTMEFHRLEPAMHRYLPRATVRNFRIDADDPHLLHWDAGQVEAGSWVAVLRPIPWCSAIVIGTGTDEPIALELPPPAQVILRIVDARNGSDVEPCTVAWHSVFPPPWSSVSPAMVERDVRTKIWRFRAPVGEIVLKPDTYRVYATRFDRVMIRPGENEITLRL